MTLDEAIKSIEEVADEWEADAKTWLECNPIGEPRRRADEAYAKCKKCAEEQYRIAEWLRELKEYRKQELILEKIKEDINNLTVYYTTQDKGINLISQRAVNRVIDKYRE